ncbi:MAG: LysM peptidoglycan-binding domain-containing protein, partial [Lachnospiraceae bacterium]|nr:LysM peptidoglycan-binding domain-containing protein [Lachnospiraceae bacterium]
MRRTKKRLLRSILCVLVALSMCMGNLCTVTAFAAEQIAELPRYVDFSRPDKLTMEDLGLDDVFHEQQTGASETISADDSENESQISELEQAVDESLTSAEPSETEAETTFEPESEVESSAESSAEQERDPAKEDVAEEVDVEAETVNMKEAETLSEETEMETETDAKEETEAEQPEAELRQPEEFYQVRTDEPEGTLVELKDFSRTYEMGDGEYVTIFGGYSGLYLDEDGNICEVDNTLVQQEASLFMGADMPVIYENRSGEYKAYLPSQMSEEQGFAISMGDYLMELIPQGGNYTDSLVSGNAIRYNNVYENIDSQYTLIGNHIKEDIILLTPTDIHSFSYELRTYGMEAELVENTITVQSGDESGAKFVLNAPMMIDANGNSSEAITMSMEEMEGKLIVTVTADKEWLDAAERVYPVRIDPTSFTVPNEHLWTYVAADGRPDYHFQSDDYSYVGYKEGWGNCRTYFVMVTDWDSVLIPGITKATFKIGQMTNHSNGTGVIGFYSPDDVWDPNQLTWNTQVDLPHNFHDSTNTVGAGEMLEFDVTEMINNWANEVKAQVGMMMRSEFEPMSEDQMIYAMPAETLYSHNYVDLGPRIEIYWDGMIEEESDLCIPIDDLTIEVDPIIIGGNAGGKAAVGVISYGLSQAESLVAYTLEQEGNAIGLGIAEAALELTSPDFTLGGAISEAEQTAPEGNWQTAGYISTVDLQLDTIYRFSAQATGYDVVANPVTGKNVLGTEVMTSSVKESDTFLLYEVKETDLLERIARHYDVSVNDIRKDNYLPDQLTISG